MAVKFSVKPGCFEFVFPITFSYNNGTVISAASLDGLAVDVFKILEENRQIINSRVEGDFIYIGE